MHSTKKRNRPRVVVVGSLNVDLIAEVGRLPAAGETVPASSLLRRFGGKGANQAVAAARQGASVAMIGCVGRDADGAAYRRYLAAEERIDVRAIRAMKGCPTGTALIAVDGRGENLIVVAAGANGALTRADVRRSAGLIRRADAVLAQLEVPVLSVLATARLANAAGVRVVLNPSPWLPDFPWGRASFAAAIVNEIEGRQLLGIPTGKIRPHLARCRARLRELRIENLIVTRGARPTICLTPAECFTVPAPRVKPVDTVGAGDAFAGVFTARWSEGCTLAEAVALANGAGALATLKPGAQEAIPSRGATDRVRRALPVRGL